MDNKNNTENNTGSDNSIKLAIWRSLWDKYRRYFQAGIIGIVFLIMVGVLVYSHDDPIAGAYKSYEEQTENKEMKKLLKNYYKYYSEGDIENLEKIATPISDKEKSYIKFMSDYVESYTINEIYSKRGTEDGSYLVSVVVDAKYKDLETEAPGLDFFYLETNKKGKLYINNLYCTFNTQNGELETDETVTALIAAFEQQDDVNELRQRVQADFNQLSLDDAAFNEYFTVTLPNAISEWAASYKKEQEEAAAKKAEEEAAAAAEAEAAAAEEAARKAEEEEEANKTTVYVTEKVNVRAEASETAESLGQVEAGTALSRYSDTDGWSKIDYNGTKAYIKSEFLTDTNPAEAESTDSDSGNSDEAAAAAGISPGDKITLSESVNLRSSADENSDREALIYAGERITVLEVLDSGWSKVNYVDDSFNAHEGYVKTEYLK